VIGECLDSVLDSCRDRLLEIIVVDNASTDRTGEVAASRRGVRILYEEKKGLLHARSRGLREAKGEFVVYLDVRLDVSQRRLCLPNSQFPDGRAGEIGEFAL
jgi:glycosyltransferase involved in cell wall biosynthesis